MAIDDIKNEDRRHAEPTVTEKMLKGGELVAEGIDDLSLCRSQCESTDLRSGLGVVSSIWPGRQDPFGS